MNIYLFNLINHLAGRNVFLDRIMIFLACYLIWIIPLFLFYLWFKKSSDQENKKLSLFILTSVVISLIFSWGISLVYFHPRPFVMNLGTQLIPHYPDSSFPSGHATAAFAVAFILLFLKKHKGSAWFFVLAFLISLARVFCGVHFPFDIIGSFFVAAIGAGIVYGFRRRENTFFEHFLKRFSR